MFTQYLFLTDFRCLLYSQALGCLLGIQAKHNPPPTSPNPNPNTFSLLGRSDALQIVYKTGNMGWLGAYGDAGIALRRGQ